MSPIALVTDSATNLPPELRSQYDITVVPVDLYLDGRLYRDEVDLSTADFYRWFRTHPDAASSTSCPSPGEFFRVYQELAAAHEAIVSVHMASGLSGTFDSAREAAAMLPGLPVELVDTRSVSMGAGFCVLAAARVVEQGGTAPQAAAAARRVADKVHMFALLDTLRYVARTGRVPAIAAHAGALLHLHPVVEVRDGHAEMVRVERTVHKATERLIVYTERLLGSRPAHLAVLHADIPEQAQALAETLKARCDPIELHIVEFTPVMGASTGPGLLGVALYAENGARLPTEPDTLDPPPPPDVTA